jgi:hypothetical protein
VCRGEPYKRESSSDKALDFHAVTDGVSLKVLPAVSRARLATYLHIAAFVWGSFVNRLPMCRLLVACTLAISVVNCGDDETSMRSNVGKAACSTDGGHQGRVIDVLVEGGGTGSAYLVYVIDREGHHAHVRPGEVRFGEDCRAGEPGGQRSSE